MTQKRAAEPQIIGKKVQTNKTSLEKTTENIHPDSIAVEAAKAEDQKRSVSGQRRLLGKSKNNENVGEFPEGVGEENAINKKV